MLIILHRNTYQTLLKFTVIYCRINKSLYPTLFSVKCYPVMFESYSKILLNYVYSWQCMSRRITFFTVPIRAFKQHFKFWKLGNACLWHMNIYFDIYFSNMYHSFPLDFLCEGHWTPFFNRNKVSFWILGSEWRIEGQNVQFWGISGNPCVVHHFEGR